ncbi:MAG: FAD-binding protein [Streptosporangiales bacterium]|nr:FAD-binding protein [Streptosporangiales bacterium]
MDDYDVVVIGGGVAGLTAGLFSARCGRSTLVLESLGPGGTLLNCEHIEDFPAFPAGVAGFELGPLLQEQAASEGAAFRGEHAQHLERRDGGWLVGADSGGFLARAVVVATGSRPRRLEVPGEKEFEGKGISNCASCDGPLFRDRAVAVVGGGDSGLVEALELVKLGIQVTVLEREQALSGQHTYRRRVLENSAIAVRHHAVVEEILGDGTVGAIRTRDLHTQEVAELVVSGVFVYTGREPNTEFLRGRLSLGEGGHIPTDIEMRTELEGVFAAGDVRAKSAGQAVAAAGDGATAALAAHRYLGA